MRALLLSLLLSIPTAASAQAFGVHLGDPPSEYAGRHPSGIDDETYYRIQVPKPNNEFEAYAAISTPQTGICKVAGLGKTHIEEDGGETRTAFDALKEALTQRYGSPKVIDYLHAGAVWDKPNEWGWSIYKKERTLIAFWLPDHGAKLPSDLTGVTLEVKAVGSDKTYVTLNYEFANFDRCHSVRGARNNQGL